ncbi:MAG TPA: YbhN family protein, partial [Acidimicrobiales bacterium]|nr:YbhN family protein [Acidimicrobiales bacterium]
MRLGLTLLALLALMVLIVTQRSVIGTSLGALDHMNWTWLPLALALEWVSIATFARMQRRLFRAGGRSATQRSIMATAVAGNAISVSVPLAGPQLGTAFAYRRFRKLGIDSALASWALIVSGVVSSLAAGIIVVGGSLLSGGDEVATTGALGGLIGVGVLVIATVALRHPPFQAAVERRLVWIVLRVQRLLHLRQRSPQEAIATFVARLRTLRLRRIDWTRVLGFGLANWLTDAGVLVVSILAVGGTVPWHGLLLAYGVRIAAGSVSITPGGLGVVEGALAVALMGVGMQRPSAVAAVLLYRFISFWLVTGVGWIVYY